MVDRKPPRMAGGERETLTGLLQFQRESLVRKVTGLDDEAARRRLVGSETTLLWLVNHLAWAEELWLAHRFADQETPLPQPRDSIADAVETYRATWTRV